MSASRPSSPEEPEPGARRRGCEPEREELGDPAIGRMSSRPSPPSAGLDAAETKKLVSSLLVVAGHLRSPLKVSKGLFDSGIGLLLIENSHQPRTRLHFHLKQENAIDRGRQAVEKIAAWAFRFRKSGRKEEIALGLVRKAHLADRPTASNIAARFALVTNPVSTCRELDIVLGTLVKALKEDRENSPDTSADDASWNEVDGRESEGNRVDLVTNDCPEPVDHAAGLGSPTGEENAIAEDTRHCTQGTSRPACEQDAKVKRDQTIGAAVQIGSKNGPGPPAISKGDNETIAKVDEGTVKVPQSKRRCRDDSSLTLDELNGRRKSGHDSRISRPRCRSYDDGARVTIDNHFPAAAGRSVSGTSMRSAHSRLRANGDCIVEAPKAMGDDTSASARASRGLDRHNAKIPGDGHRTCSRAEMRSKEVLARDVSFDASGNDRVPEPEGVRPFYRRAASADPVGSEACRVQRLKRTSRSVLSVRSANVIGLRNDVRTAKEMVTRTETRLRNVQYVLSHERQNRRRDVRRMATQMNQIRSELCRANSSLACAERQLVLRDRTIKKYKRLLEERQKELADLRMKYTQAASVSRVSDLNRHVDQATRAAPVGNPPGKENTQETSDTGAEGNGRQPPCSQANRLNATGWPPLPQSTHQPDEDTQSEYIAQDVHREAKDSRAKTSHIMSSFRAHEASAVDALTAEKNASSTGVPASSEEELPSPETEPAEVDGRGLPRSNESVESCHLKREATNIESPSGIIVAGDAQPERGTDLSDIPSHIRDNWASESSSEEDSDDEDESSDEDSDDEDGGLSSGTEEEITARRKRLLELQAPGLGGLATLAGMGADILMTGAKLGGGSYGAVHKLNLKPSKLKKIVNDYTAGEGVAVKVALKGGAKAALREISVLARLQPGCHPNIICAFSTHKASRTIVMETMQTDLSFLIQKKNDSKLVSDAKMITLCFGAARGLAHMHREDLVHCDVKPENILIRDNFTTCKIADFGSAGEAGVTLIGGLTMAYAAPEAAITRRGLDVQMQKSMDVYSLALVILQALFRKDFGPLEPDVLREYDTKWAPEENAEALRIADANLEIKAARAYDTRARDDINGEHQAARITRVFRNLYSGMTARLMALDDYLLSPVVWEGLDKLTHHAEVRKILASMLDPDPRRRCSMRLVASALAKPNLWVERCVRRREKRNPPDMDAMAVLAEIEDEVQGVPVDGPEWLRSLEREGQTWWKKVPMPPRLKAPKSSRESTSE